MTRAVLQALKAGAAPSTEALLEALASSLESGGHTQKATLSATIAHDLAAPFTFEAVTTPRSDDDLPPARQPVRAAGAPKQRRRQLEARAAAPTFRAPRKSEWRDAPKTRAAAAGGGAYADGGAPSPPLSPARGASSGALPLASQHYGSNLAGAESVDWRALTASLPVGKDDASRARRRELFGRFDFNGNGYLSLAEVDKAVRSELGAGSAVLFSSKPVLMRAFQAAKGAVKTSSSLGGDYVEWAEFRLLLVYLRQYFEIDAAYNRLDSSDDRRLSLPEFRSGVELLGTWGIDIPEGEVQAEFDSIDTNGGGVILFDEFSDWALKKQLDLEDDDDFDDGTDVRCVSAAEGAGHAASAASVAAGTSRNTPASGRRPPAAVAGSGRSAAAAAPRQTWNERAQARGNPDIPFGRRRPGTAGSSASGGDLRERDLGASLGDTLGSLGGGIPESPARPPSGLAGSRSARPSSAALSARAEPGTRASRARAAAAAATLALEARGSNPRSPGGVQPADLPASLSRPLCGGAMPARPLSALPRTTPTSSAEPSRYGEFKPPSEVVAPTKPRVLGGGFSREARLNPPKTVNPHDSTGGKTVNRFPWGNNKEAGIFPQSQPLKQNMRTVRTARQVDSGFHRGGGEFAVDTSLGTTTLG